MMNVSKEDVQYMIDNGPRAYLAHQFKEVKFDELFHRLYWAIRKTLYSLGKTITLYIILSKTYDVIGLEKFCIMLVAGHLAVKSWKGEEKKSKDEIESPEGEGK